MSRPFIARTASLSSDSSFTSLGDVDGDGDHDAQPTGTLGPGSKQLQLDMKRTRKRFSHDQLVVLEQAYYHTSHPSREERQCLAGLTGMDVKSVTIWFQNKRQTERRVSTGSVSTRNAPLPPSLYPILYSTTSHPHPLIAEPARSLRIPDYASASFPSSLSKPTHTPRPKSNLSSPSTSRALCMSLSLDRVASRAERPPRTPTKPARRASSYEHWIEPTPALWESIPSSPSTPERPKATSASRTSPSTRDFLDFASARHGYGKRGSRIRSRRTLEWACAAARFSVDKEDIEMSSKAEKMDIEIEQVNMLKLAAPALTFSPALFESERSPTFIDDDASTEIIDTEAESVDECQEAITPDASQILYSYNSSPTLDPLGKSPEKENVNTAEMARNMKNLRIEKDSAILDAAWALCGLSSIRG